MTYGMILAAGRGARLGHDVPKALIRWGPATLVDLHMDLLARAGVHDVWLVVGFRSDLVRAHVAPRWPKARFVENPRFLDAQNGKSFLVGAKAVPPGGLVALNSDVAFDDGILQRLLADTASSGFAVVPKVCGEEEMKYRIAAGAIQAVSKQVHGDGEVIGINYICAADRPLLEKALEYNDDSQYYERSFDQMLPFTARPVRAVSVDPLRAVEIDFPEDLEAARRLFGEPRPAVPALARAPRPASP